MSNNFCEGCGAPIEEGFKFCNVCGKSANINSTPISDSSATQQANSNTSSNYGSPYQQPTSNAYQQPNQGYNPQSYGSQPNQPYYPQQNIFLNAQNNTPMSVGDYIIAFLLVCIPLAGLILLIVWASSTDININKKNFAKAYLILIGIFFGLYILLIIFLTAVGASLAH